MDEAPCFGQDGPNQNHPREGFMKKERKRREKKTFHVRSHSEFSVCGVSNPVLDVSRWVKLGGKEGGDFVCFCLPP